MSAFAETSTTKSVFNTRFPFETTLPVTVNIPVLFTLPVTLAAPEIVALPLNARVIPEREPTTATEEELITALIEEFPTRMVVVLAVTLAPTETCDWLATTIPAVRPSLVKDALTVEFET
jgi:hypothetical protein